MPGFPGSFSSLWPAIKNEFIESDKKRKKVVDILI